MQLRLAPPTDEQPYQVSTLQIPVLDEAEKARFETKYEVGDGECWIWTAYSYNGYGRVTIRGKAYRAHRVGYTLHKGQIPQGLTLDHLCRVTLCVNAEHLEAVTIRENVMRSPIGRTAVNARKTHCPRGHAYNDENTYMNRRMRICRHCGRDNARRRRAERHGDALRAFEAARK